MSPVADSSMLVHGTHLHGVELRHLVEHPDGRGSFTEVFSVERDTVLEPQQWSVVLSVRGAFRGMHLHRRHDEYVSVVNGQMTVGLHDLRADSPTFGMSASYRLSGLDPASLAFPRGIVHGWLAEEATTHLQAVSETYASYGADDNDGCQWDDPDLNLAWPMVPTVFSDRSRAFGALRALRPLEGSDITA